MEYLILLLIIIIPLIPCGFEFKFKRDSGEGVDIKELVSKLGLNKRRWVE